MGPPAVVAARPAKPRKLRQTCDACAEAKIKCDQGDPRCGRCDRLSYECVYSPARRIGRPRPRSPRAQDQQRRLAREEASASTAALSTTSTSTKEGVHHDAKANNNATAPPPQADPPAVAPHYHDFSDYVNDPVASDCYNSMTGDVELRTSTRAFSSSAAFFGGGDSKSSGNNNNHNNDPSLLAGLTDGLPIGFEGQHQAAPSSMAMQVGDFVQIQHSPYEYDCSTVAVAALKKLTAADLLEGRPAGDQQLSSTSNSSGSIISSSNSSSSSAAEDVLADHIPHACREAARILVCPCSAEMDMALLAASLTNAILEVANAALRALEPPVVEHHQHLLPGNNNADDGGGGDGSGQRTVLALGTITRISQVVTLFTHRYSVAQSGSQPPPPEALLLLAASSRTSLKAMAEETMNRFFDGGSHGGGGGGAGVPVSRS